MWSIGFDADAIELNKTMQEIPEKKIADCFPSLSLVTLDCARKYQRSTESSTYKYIYTYHKCIFI